MPRNDDISIRAGSMLARPLQVDAIEKGIKKQLDSNIRAHFGLSGQMPADLKDAVEQASKVATQRAVETAVAKLAEDASRDAGRDGLLKRFDSNLKFASDGMKVIDGSSNVQSVLDRRAKLLAKKRTALEKAGFTTDEAFQIILTDIEARS